jgi:transcriptional regulator with XRE-family HTH domain
VETCCAAQRPSGGDHRLMDNPVLTQWLTAPEGLASRMRALRVRAELTGKELATGLGWGAYKVSRLENGHQLPSVTELKAWVEACHAVDELDALVDALEHSTSVRLAWRHRFAEGQQPIQASYNELTTQSTSIIMFQTAVVPGVLQTADYATAILLDVMANHDQPVTDVAEAVTVRMQRGQLLYDRAKSFELIVTETVLRGSPAPPAVMIAQLDRLLNALDLSNVELRILPARAGVAFVPVNSFEIYDDELVLVESLAGEEHHLEGDGEVATYQRALERLRSASVGGDDARAIIQAAIEQHRIQGS